MKWYRVELVYGTTIEMEVEANNEEEAGQIAIDEVDYDFVLSTLEGDVGDITELEEPEL